MADFKIIYFSATGGGEKIAAAFAENLAKDGAVPEIINITLKSGRQAPFAAADDNIFILPVYNGAIPAVCAEYVQDIDGAGKRAHICCVYGGVHKGGALKNAASLLMKRGFIPVRGAYIPAQHAYPRKKINVLDKERLNRIYADFFNQPAVKNLKLTQNPSGWQKQSTFKKLTGRCALNKELCNDCGLCRKICPVNAIDTAYCTTNGCILCGACVEKCPRKARKIKFYTFISSAFIALKCKPRKDEYFNFVHS